MLSNPIERGSAFLRWTSAAVLAAALLLAGTAARAAESMVNHPAPPFSCRNLQHRPVSLTAYRGKVVLLNFWATWCAPCRLEMPRFVAWQTRYGSRGLQVLGVSIDDDVSTVRPFVARMKLNYPVVMGDARLGERYGGVLGVPVTFLIDRQGVIRARFDGEADLNRIEVEIQKLLSSSAR